MTHTRKTTANPLLTAPIYPQLIRLMIPLLIGNILQQCYNIVDSLIIGRLLGIDAFSAIGVAGTIMNLMIFILNGFCTGLSVIFSTMYGKRDFNEFRKEMFVSVSYGSALTLGITTLFLIILHPLLHLIRTPQELIVYVTEYLTVIAVSLIATYAYNLLSSILRSIGNTAAALVFLLVSVMANVGLDILFVANFQLGIGGAAWATALSQLLSAAGCWCYLKTHNPELIFTKKDIGLHRNLLKTTLRFGAASAIQSSNLYIGKMLVQGAVNLLGTAAIAGFTAALRLEGFCNSFGDSGALSVSVLVSQNQGAGQKNRVQEVLRKGVIFHVILGITIPSVMLLFTVPGLKLFLDSSAGGTNAGTIINSDAASSLDSLAARALTQGIGYLRIIAFFYILCFVGSSLVGYFRGVGMVHVPVIGTTLNISTRVLLSYPLTQRFGLPGLAAATGIGWMIVVSYQIWNLWRNDSK